MLPTKYPVDEAFSSFQGEGEWIGVPAYFIRLAGCNICCPFCDQKSAWNAQNASYLTASELFKASQQYFTHAKDKTCVVTGGEPTMHPLGELTTEFRKQGIKMHLETSGVNEISGVFDWVTVSPKKGASLRFPLAEASEIKLVIEHKGDIAYWFSRLKLDSPWLENKPIWFQPVWDEEHQACFEESMREIREFIVDAGNNRFRAGWQIHKMYGAR